MFSLPVPRRNLRFQEISSVFRPLQSLRRARLIGSGGFEPERQPVLKATFLLQGRFLMRRS